MSECKNSPSGTHERDHGNRCGWCGVTMPAQSTDAGDVAKTGPEIDRSTLQVCGGCRELIVFHAGRWVRSGREDCTPSCRGSQDGTHQPVTPASPAAVGDGQADPKDEQLRRIIQHMVESAVELTWARHLSGTDLEDLKTADVIEDITSVMCGDDTGCLDPEDESPDTIELLWLKRELATAPTPSVAVGELPPLMKQLETEAEIKRGKMWAEMFVHPQRFLDALAELRSTLAQRDAELAGYRICGCGHNEDAHEHGGQCYGDQVVGDGIIDNCPCTEFTNSYDTALIESTEKIEAAEARITELEEALRQAKGPEQSRLTAEDADTLRKILVLGPEENARLTKHDIVFNRFPRDMKEHPPVGEEIWEALAFSLHTDVWEASTLAERILANASITKETT